jgi:hypothetical protein
MGIGYKELMILLVLLAVMVFVVMMIIRSGSKSSRVTARTVAERLTELETLRNAGQITMAEYEKQRAAIVSSV